MLKEHTNDLLRPLYLCSGRWGSWVGCGERNGRMPEEFRAAEHESPWSWLLRNA